MHVLFPTVGYPISYLLLFSVIICSTFVTNTNQEDQL